MIIRTGLSTEQVARRIEEVQSGSGSAAEINTAGCHCSYCHYIDMPHRRAPGLTGCQAVETELRPGDILPGEGVTVDYARGYVRGCHSGFLTGMLVLAIVEATFAGVVCLLARLFH